MRDKLLFCTPVNAQTPTTTAITVVGPDGIQHAEVPTEKLLNWIGVNAKLTAPIGAATGGNYAGEQAQRRAG